MATDLDSAGSLRFARRRAQALVVFACLWVAMGTSACAASGAADPRPAPPLKPSAAAGPGSATIHWLVPKRELGTIVRYWMVPYVRSAHGRSWLRLCSGSKHCPADADATIVPNGSTAGSGTVTGLSSGHVYSFRVAAAGASGLGRLSRRSNAVLVRGAGPKSPVTMFGSATLSSSPQMRKAPGEIGIRFRANIAGTVDGIRFFKTARDTGSHVGSIWDAKGRLLARARFRHETHSGWQSLHFSHPVSLYAGDSYIAGYGSSSGNYASSPPQSVALSRAEPLVPVQTKLGGDGLYGRTRNAFPRSTTGTNFWVDVYFVPADPSAQNLAAQPIPIGATDSLSVHAPTPSAGGSPPVDSTQPAVTGDMQVGQTLSSTSGTWSNNPTSYGYQWEDCNLQGLNCSIISGAGSATYTVKSSDVGSSLRSVVTAINAGGSTAMYSGATGLATQACTSTYTPASIGNGNYGGAALEAAISNGQGGPVYCLASGDYSSLKNGEISVYSANPANGITIEPAPGAAALNVDFSISGVSNLTLQDFGGINTASSSDGLTVVGATDGFGNNTNVSFLNNHMDADGVTIKNDSTNANIYIARNQFVGFANSGEQSRLLLNTTSACPNGVTIAHNLLSGGQADGIDVDGGTCGTQITGNEISNIMQSDCGPIHCDAFQDNGGGEGTSITDNFIHDTTDCWGLYDGLSGYTLEDNVCSSPAPDTSYWMQLGGADGFTFVHNTVTSSAGAPYYNYDGSNTNLNFSDNIWYSVPSPDRGNPVSGTFTDDYNLSPSSDTAGAHNKTGKPTFAGGSSPTAWTGFAIASNSAGYNAAGDGQNMGVQASYFNIGTSQPSGTLPGING